MLLYEGKYNDAAAQSMRATMLVYFIIKKNEVSTYQKFGIDMNSRPGQMTLSIPGVLHVSLSPYCKFTLTAANSATLASGNGNQPIGVLINEAKKKGKRKTAHSTARPDDTSPHVWPAVGPTRCHIIIWLYTCRAASGGTHPHGCLVASPVSSPLFSPPRAAREPDDVTRLLSPTPPPHQARPLSHRLFLVRQANLRWVPRPRPVAIIPGRVPFSLPG